MTATLSPEQERTIPQAEAYIATRFFPPLPSVYGRLAVEAVALVNEGSPESTVTIPLDCAMFPSAAVETEDGFEIEAAELVYALRLGHMIEDEEDYL